MKHTKRCRGGIAIRTRFLADARKYLTWRECRSCGTWLPLGPSDEAPVAVEVRAAEIADKATRRDPLMMSEYTDGAEQAGWLVRACDSAKVPDQDGEHAGYLARVIYDHDAEQMAAARDAAAKLTDEDFARMGVPTPNEAAR